MKHLQISSAKRQSLCVEFGALIMLGCVLVAAIGCDGASDTREPGKAHNLTFSGGYPIKATVTVGMVADLVREIGGEHVQVTQLMGTGVDPHLYKPTADDANAIITADIVFYNGLLLEGKMSETLENISNRVAAFAAAESLRKDLLAADPEEQSHPDPHVWMDVSMWIEVAQAIADELSRFDPPNAEDYQSAATELTERLTELHTYGMEVMAAIPEDQRILVTSHDAFRYFGRSYGVEVQAIQGISTESEAGLNRINELVDLLVERKVRSVFVESSVPRESIEALLSGARAKGHDVLIGGPLYSDAMGSQGTYEGTYIGMMDHNLTRIALALGNENAPASGLHQNFLPTAGMMIRENLQNETPLSIRNVTVAYQRKPVLWNVSLDVPGASLVGLVGPNGAGKSTLLKSVVDLVPRISGEVRVFGRPYHSARRTVAYVPQRESVDWDFPATALDVVLMGTYGRLGWFQRVGKKQRQEALECLEKMEIGHLANRQISQLSGGQQQRTFLARALVQQAELYLMDEPFAAVDAATEQAIVTLMRELQSANKTIVVVHHDLHTVPKYFDHVILLNLRLVAAGRTDVVFTQDNLQKTYGGKLTLLEEVGEAMRLRGEGPT